MSDYVSFKGITTWQWAEEIEGLKNTSSSQQVYLNSTVLGYYFEAALIWALTEVATQANRINVPAKQSSKYLQSMARKLNFNQVKPIQGMGVNATNAIGALQTVRASAQDSGFRKSTKSMSYKLIQEAKKEIEELARHFISEDLMLKFGNQIQKFGVQTIKISSIGESQQSVKGDPVGDVKLQIGDEVFILEAKYQSSAYSNIPIRWFSGLSDEKLFNKGFANFLAGEADTYWNYDLSDHDWRVKLQREALPEYIKEAFGNDANTLLKWIIHKGHVQTQHEDTSLRNAVKMVIHGHKGTLSITATPDILQSMESVLAGITVQKPTGGMFQLFTSRNHYLSFQSSDSPGQELAAFGLTSFGRTRGSRDANQKGKWDSKETIIKNKAKFSFSMLVAQHFLYHPIVALATIN